MLAGTNIAVVRPAAATPKLSDNCCSVLEIELALLAFLGGMSAYTRVFMLVYYIDETNPRQNAMRTMRETATREAMPRRRKVLGEITGIRPVLGPPGDEDPTLTAANRTGTSPGDDPAAGGPAWWRPHRSS